MLLIRAEQMKVFSKALTERFEMRVASHLRAAFPETCAGLDEANLLAIVRQGIKRATSYQINTELDVWKFIDLMFFYGRDFDSAQPAAAAILQDADADGTQKVNRLYAELGANVAPAPSIYDAAKE